MSSPTSASMASHALRRPLYAVAGAVALLAAALFFRGQGDGGFPTLLPAASAQVRPPGVGGSDLYLMPGQLASSMWGVYVMDTDRQAILVYQYDAGGKQLRLLAARAFANDLQLSDFNTFPPPEEVRRILELERQNDRVGQ